MSETKLNLWQKIHAVMSEVEYLSKDGAISFGKTQYKAITEEKVTTAVRQALVKHGLIILPVEQAHHKDGNLTTVDVKYKIIDTENGEYETVASSGTGADTQDKGVGKAMTYSFKYMLLRAFAIPTGEDPDKTSNAEIEENQKKEEKKKQEQQHKKLNDGIAVKFSEALQAVGGDKKKLYEELQTNKKNMEQLYASNNQKQKENAIKQLEGIINDYRNAG